jgi:hypothetical protein
MNDGNNFGVSEEERERYRMREAALGVGERDFLFPGKWLN